MPLSDSTLWDISSDGTVLSTQSTQPEIHTLWSWRPGGNSPRPYPNLSASSAAWSPEGDRIACGDENTLTVANKDGMDSRTVASLRGRQKIEGVRWSPDGEILRFSEHDVSTDLRTLWEVGVDGTHLQPLISASQGAHWEYGGDWTPGGGYFLFTSRRNGRPDVWAIREKNAFFRKVSHEPVRLTAGPLDYAWLRPSKDGKRLFVIAAQPRQSLECYNLESKAFVRYLSGISAVETDFSRDGRWVAYVSYPDYRLWVSRSDGSEARPLTALPA